MIYEFKNLEKRSINERFFFDSLRVALNRDRIKTMKLFGTMNAAKILDILEDRIRFIFANGVLAVCDYPIDVNSKLRLGEIVFYTDGSVYLWYINIRDRVVKVDFKFTNKDIQPSYELEEVK